MTKVHTIPLHIGDLLTDTMHLSPAELGGYLRLLAVHYRIGTDGLPDDEAQLRRITGMDNKTWKSARPTLLAFFTLSGDRRWVHGKVQTVLYGIRSKQEQNAAKALKRWNRADAAALPQQSHGSAAAMQSISHKPEAISSGAKAPSPPPTPKKPKVGLTALSVDHIADWLAEKRAQGRYLCHDEHFVLDQFKNYCQSKGKKYADYIAGYRNAFEWDRCQPQREQGATDPVGQSKWLTAADQIIAEDRATGRWKGRI